ncbi:MAG: septum formation initiator family protein [Rickettsiaceae bacterium]|nr:septum formation initiator family protein [Rickettsiaceae bacterium]MDP4832110.1 septum formation initiator family protein [Rickettsiaceae bacterium]MDP5020306.1 septum formation initiator family protein [Rickettsiaceae bacterium]MDP5082626.1 septum formation initiator family protein [Rickettsiaceae bacterium]
MTYRERKSFVFTKKSFFNALVLLMLLYFVFHSIYGSRGIIAYFTLQSELESSHKKLELLRAERLDIENRTKLLRPGSLDRDMLDETTRNVLGFSSPKEQIYKATTVEQEN